MRRASTDRSGTSPSSQGRRSRHPTPPHERTRTAVDVVLPRTASVVFDVLKRGIKPHREAEPRQRLGHHAVGRHRVFQREGTV